MWENNRFFQASRIYLLSVAVAVAFLLLGVTFIYYAELISKNDVIRYIRTNTWQMRFILEDYLQGEFQTLSAAAIYDKDDDVVPGEKCLAFLSAELRKFKNFVDVGLTDSEGRAVWLGRDNVVHSGDFSGEPFVQRALSGKNALTDRRRSFSGEKYVFVFAVPIISKESIRGVLFASIPEEALSDVLEKSLYAGEGLVHIVTRNGDCVLPSRSPLKDAAGSGIFALLEPLSLKSRERILNDMAAGKDGYLEKSFFSEKRLIAYEPLSINAWYIFYAVRENLVYAGPKLIRNGAVGVIGVAVALFVLLIFLIRRINEKSREMLERMAFEDPVTGHCNFRKFMIEAEEILKKEPRECYSLWYGDIFGFKYINDLFGRDAGDRLLRYCTMHMAINTQPNEAFARISGDIFVLLRRVAVPEEIEARYRRSVDLVAQFPETANEGYKVRQYCGVYILNRQDGDLAIDDMIYRANMAQKSVKGSSVHFALYSNSMRERMLWEKEMERRMESALENGEFVPYFQPKIDLRNGDRVTGMEVLVRWETRDRGLISPSDFVPLFEKNGFIVNLDRWLFRKACEIYGENFTGNNRPPLVLAVNVSRLGLLKQDFVAFYSEVKEKYLIPDDYVELEFTESLAFENDALFQSVVSNLQGKGFLCSLDDFGAGYSSLNILQNLQVDILKLDGLFFRYGPKARRAPELIKNIIAMTATLGMKTVAEGVEKEFQVEQLRRMSCDFVQGYVFAPPMPLEGFMKFLGTERRGGQDAWDRVS